MAAQVRWPAAMQKGAVMAVVPVLVIPGVKVRQVLPVRVVVLAVTQELVALPGSLQSQDRHQAHPVRLLRVAQVALILPAAAAAVVMAAAAAAHSQAAAAAVIM